MGTYYGKISGIGNPTERINEITADDLATLRHFQMGWDYGVIDRQGYNFYVRNNLFGNVYTVDNKLTLTATRDDYYTTIGGTPAYLEAGKTYTVRYESDALFNGDVELFIAKYGAYSPELRTSGKELTFVCPETGYYYIRVDVNNKGDTKSFWNFEIVEGTEKLERIGISVGKGIMFAYGYVGFVDECKLEFIRPAISQYHIIYVELDRSKIPNTCILKVKNNQSSTSIERTFRQDYLDKVRTGIFQLPLWRVKVGSNGIEEVVDLRKLYDKPKQVQYSINTKRVVGKIDSGVTAVTQPNNDNSNKIATTMFVHNATRDYIDNN